VADSDDRTPADLLCDLFVYAPLGFVFEAPKLVPELAARGREQVAAARTVGRFVVEKANERLGPVVGSVLNGFLSGLRPTDDRGDRAKVDADAAVRVETTDSPAGARGERSSEVETPNSGAATADGVAPSRTTSSSGSKTSTRRQTASNGSSRRRKTPEAATLGIPEYDSLAASQVVPRLAALTPDELAAVRAYEAAHRGRRTILGRVDQLLGHPGAQSG
jgi:hypothetical protein